MKKNICMVSLLFTVCFCVQAPPPPVAAPWMALSWSGAEDSSDDEDSNPPALEDDKDSNPPARTE